jgi:hypothetical protein
MSCRYLTSKNHTENLPQRQGNASKNPRQRYASNFVLVDDALKQKDLSVRLSQVPYERYKEQRAQWNARLSDSVLRRRFRGNPESYLKQLEEKYSALVIPVVVF